jgi:hypothetical protein
MRSLLAILILSCLCGCQNLPPHTVTVQEVRLLNFVPAHAYYCGMIDLPDDELPINQSPSFSRIQFSALEVKMLKEQAAAIGANCIYTECQSFNGRYLFRCYWLPRDLGQPQSGH